MRVSLNRKCLFRLSNRIKFLVAIALLTLSGCAAWNNDPIVTPYVNKGYYMDEGPTIMVGDSYLGSEDGLTLLESLQRTTDELNVVCEQRALIRQELMGARNDRDGLQKNLDSVQNQVVGLNTEISSIKLELLEKESELEAALREQRNLMEQLVNIKIEKNKVEKQLLKIKINALSGEG